jgi:hypothetical protein
MDQKRNNKRSRYQLTYPFEGWSIYKSSSVEKAVKKCYNEFKNLNDVDEGLFGVTDLDNNIEYQFRIDKNKNKIYKQSKSTKAQKGGNTDNLAESSLHTDYEYVPNLQTGGQTKLRVGQFEGPVPGNPGTPPTGLSPGPPPPPPMPRTQTPFEKEIIEKKREFITSQQEKELSKAQDILEGVREAKQESQTGESGPDVDIDTVRGIVEEEVSPMKQQMDTMSKELSGLTKPISISKIIIPSHEIMHGLPPALPVGLPLGLPPRLPLAQPKPNIVIVPKIGLPAAPKPEQPSEISESVNIEYQHSKKPIEEEKEEEEKVEKKELVPIDDTILCTIL